MIEGLVSENAVVPVVILTFVVAKLGFVSVEIEERWLNAFKVVLQLFLGRLLQYFFVLDNFHHPDQSMRWCLVLNFVLLLLEA